MVAYTYDPRIEAPPAGIAYADATIVGNHAYAVLGVFPNDYIVMRNPWGQKGAGPGSGDPDPTQLPAGALASGTWYGGFNLADPNDAVFALKASVFRNYFKGFGWVIPRSRTIECMQRRGIEFMGVNNVYGASVLPFPGGVNRQQCEKGSSLSSWYSFFLFPPRLCLCPPQWHRDAHHHTPDLDVRFSSGNHRGYYRLGRYSGRRRKPDLPVTTWDQVRNLR